MNGIYLTYVYESGHDHHVYAYDHACVYVLYHHVYVCALYAHACDHDRDRDRVHDHDHGGDLPLHVYALHRDDGHHVLHGNDHAYAFFHEYVMNLT